MHSSSPRYHPYIKPAALAMSTPRDRSPAPAGAEFASPVPPFLLSPTSFGGTNSTSLLVTSFSSFSSLSSSSSSACTSPASPSPCPFPRAPPPLSYHSPALPLVPSSDNLHTVSCATLAALLSDRAAWAGHGFDEVRVLDCRFDFEYEGGHIDGAVHLADLGALDALLEEAASCRLCLIVHCEFSAHRGPAVYRQLRRRDRELNGIAHFPRLFLPELYLLQGGYAAFHQAFPGLCQPRPGAYVAMVDSRFQAELKVRWKQRKADTTAARASSRAASPTAGSGFAIILPPAPHHSRTQTLPVPLAVYAPSESARVPFLLPSTDTGDSASPRFLLPDSAHSSGLPIVRPMRSQSVLVLGSLNRDEECGQSSED